MQSFRLCVVGGHGVGKTRLSAKFESFMYDPAIEDKYRRLVLVDQQYCVISAKPISGQEDFTAMRDVYWRGCEGFLFVYAVDSFPSFEEIMQIRTQIMKATDNENFAMVLCGNKSDSKNRVIMPNAGRELAKMFGCPFIETSAKDGVNVEEAFHELVREIRRKKIPPPPTCNRRKTCPTPSSTNNYWMQVWGKYRKRVQSVKS